MTEELKPCPFCGGEAVLETIRPGGTGSSGMETPRPFTKCKAGCVEMRPIKCDDWGWGKKNGWPSSQEAKAEAIAAWNTRQPDAVPGDLVERLLAFEGSDSLGNGDFAVCPEAAAAINSLTAERDAALAMVADLASELEAELAAKGIYDTFPKMVRNLEPVLQARALLKRTKP